MVLRRRKALWDMGDKTGRGFIEDVVAGQQDATDGGVKGALRRADRLRYDPKKMAIIGAKSASGALLGPFNIGVSPPSKSSRAARLRFECRR